MSLTPEQILALAPDPASAKAGSGQASPSYWSGLGANAQALWGLCQGSGKEPYRTQIELAGPAFKCSCPSRKFPCKHGLGLYLLFAKQAAAFGSDEAPEWVREWLHSREQRSEKKAAKEEQAAQQEATLSPEQVAARDKAQQKRQDKRAQNVAQGFELLDTWLQDLAREGLAGLPGKPAANWEAMAARMVDAQAPGLAYRIRKAGSLLYSKQGAAHWELAVGRELAQLALLSQCHARLEQFGPEWQADIRSAIGWATPQEDALAQAPLEDVWQVCGQQTQQDDKISRRATYLRGKNSGRWAMLLHFAAGGQTLPPPLLPAIQYHGKLHFYPGATPLRALMAADAQADSAPQARLHAGVPATKPNPDENAKPGFARELQDYAALLACNPLLDQYPMLLPDVTPHYLATGTDGKGAAAFALGCTDSASDAASYLPIDATFTQGWLMLALSGGHAATVFGLWNGYSFWPLTLATPERIHSFDMEPV
ncbi:MAG: hypothetical protein RL748_2020 [Pseudomonadota bacterium]|jgi:hypothetical protein